MQKWGIGVDLGGTKIEIAIVSDSGQLLDCLRIPTESNLGAENIIDRITEAILKLSQRQTDIVLSAVGIGVAGQIHKETGTIIYAPNLEWRDVKLQQLLTDKLHMPVTICNDVKAAAWGEWLFGAGVGCNNLVCIFVGTGIGGAIISDGRMLEGCNNTAGEIGHMTLQLHGPLCHCGNEGCFEALAGGWAIQRDARQAVQNDTRSGKLMLEIAGGNIDAVNGKTVTDAAQKGDNLANKLIDHVADVLIAGIASVVNIVGPCRIILGGGVIEGMPHMIDHIQSGVQKYALKAAVASVTVLPAKLHNDSGVIGAAALALHELIAPKSQ
jgi:glucokinase